MSKERRPHSEAVNRRRILAATRQAAVIDIREIILEKTQAARRLEEIEQLLSGGDSGLSFMNAEEMTQTRTVLEIESIWLKFKLGRITPSEKQQLLSGKFDELEQANPDVYQWLVAKNEQGLSMAEQIRDKVIPPITIAGFHTKR